MLLTNCAVALDESRKAALQHRVALVFVEFLHDHRPRELQAGIPIGFEHDSGRFPLADTRPGANAVESDVVPYPVLAQQASLGFPGCRELVVVWFREGSLPVAHQENTAHVARSNRPAAPWPPPMHMVTTPQRCLRRAISLAIVPTMREPVMPNGWPMAMEPPLGFSFSGSIPRRSRQ